MSELSMDERIARLRETFEASESFWIACAQNDLAEVIYGRMEDCELTKSGLAAKLGVSRGYISRMLSGDANLTIRRKESNDASPLP